jgi:argininosuccinate lyase
MSPAKKKLWGGRFTALPTAEVDHFNASVSFDQRLFPQDIEGSIAHAYMLGKKRILKSPEVKKIVRGLEKIKNQIEAGKFRWSIDKEDVHLNIESKLIENIGPTGGKLHTARSRNDQVATDLRLWTREQVETLQDLLLKFQSTLIDLGKRHVDTLLPGYTHLQRAQPISLGHYLLAYVEMAQRDWERLEDSLKRINTLPLGAGALAGTTFPIDRQAVAARLGFAEVARNSMDAVSDRDFVIETLSNLSLIMMHLSRLAEEWILWASQEFQFIQLPQEFCTGSSMMPQKINPDVLELIRGKSGRVFGALVALLTVMKGLPLAYNKDLQEDKEPLFDAIDTTQACLKILSAMIPKVRFNTAKMGRAMSEGFVLATDLADYLTTKGLPFRLAHEVVGKIVAYCQKRQCELKDLRLEDLKNFEKKIGPDVFQWLDESHAVDRRASMGGTARKNVRAELAKAHRRIKSTKK